MLPEAPTEVASAAASRVRRVVFEDLGLAVILGLSSIVLFELEYFYGDWDAGLLPLAALFALVGMAARVVEVKPRLRAPAYADLSPAVETSTLPRTALTGLAAALLLAVIGWAMSRVEPFSILVLAGPSLGYSIRAVSGTVRTFSLERSRGLRLYRPSGRSHFGSTRFFWALPVGSLDFVAPQEVSPPGPGPEVALRDRD